MTEMVSASRSRQRLPYGAFRTLILVALAALFAGCVLATQSGTGDRDQQPSSGKLIKPFIPQGPSTTTPGNPTAPEVPTAMAPDGTSPRPAQPVTVAQPEVPRQVPPPVADAGLKKPQLQKNASPAQAKNVLWEDQKVKRSAMQMLKKYPTVKKVKICYAVKDDEWWVILYDDLDTHYELRQFTWDRDQGRLRPFLVLKRLARNQLQEHLTASEPDRACEVLNPTSIQTGTAASPADF